jgi:hypothetical protein
MTLVADRNRARRLVGRAQLVLATAEGGGTAEIVRRAGVSGPSVWRWQERLMARGRGGALARHDAEPGIAPLPVAIIERMGAEPSGQAMHRVGRAATEATGISQRPAPRAAPGAGRAPTHGRQPLAGALLQTLAGPAFAAERPSIVGL